jgi:capsid portal protein
MVRAAGQLLRAGKKPARRRSPQLPDLRKAQHSDQHLIPHPLLSRQDFSRFVLDYLVFGNAFLEKREHDTASHEAETLTGQIHPRGVWRMAFTGIVGFLYPRSCAGSVFHLLEPDINQELYGMPEYLSALNSAWLNESATLFRRKYYQNGAHAGYIMYVTDAAQSTDVEALREAMRSSKSAILKTVFLRTERKTGRH